MAMWMVQYKVFRQKKGAPELMSFILHAADAKTMKRRDLNAAVRNAKTRAKAHLKILERGYKTAIVSVACVG